MKKILLILLLLFTLPCFAKNSIQKELHKEHWNNSPLAEKFMNFGKLVFMYEDYQAWKKNSDVETQYGKLFSMKNKHCSLGHKAGAKGRAMSPTDSTTKNSNNCKYATLALNNFTKIGEMDVISEDNARKILKDNPIIIDDKIIYDLDADLLYMIIFLF